MCCSSGGYNLRKCGHAVLQSGSIAASTGSAILPKTRPRRPLPPPPPQQPSSSAVRCIKCEYYNQSINQSMAVTDAGTKVPLCPYHTFYTLLGVTFAFSFAFYTSHHSHSIVMYAVIALSHIIN